jgi:bifunctional DNase/RNase
MCSQEKKPEQPTAFEPWPLTHDIVLDTLALFGARLLNVIVYDGAEKQRCFRAKLIVQQQGSRYEMDVRPSGAVCLAIKGTVPIFVREKSLRA